MNHTTRRHPVGALLSYAALGQRPSRVELDALKLPAAQRQRVDDAAREAAALKADGRNLEASRSASEHAANIIAALPDDLQDPDYLREPDPLADVNDPAALAAAVRWW